MAIRFLLVCILMTSHANAVKQNAYEMSCIFTPGLQCGSHLRWSAFPDREPISSLRRLPPRTLLPVGAQTPRALEETWWPAPDNCQAAAFPRASRETMP